MDYWHKRWACPFFRWDQRRRVACEGRCGVVMADREEAAAYMERYCASLNGWERCALARALLGRYERREATE